MAILVRWVAIVFLALGGLPGLAQTSGTTDTEDSQDIDTLFDVLALPEILAIMETENLAYGAQVGAEMLFHGGGALWKNAVADIYRSDKSAEIVKRGLEREISKNHRRLLIEFFTSDIGRAITNRELVTRQAFLDKEIEQGARRHFRALELGGEQESPRLKQVGIYVQLNDLVEYNVVGALNANYWFLRGLAQSDAFEMTEEDMISQAWSSQDETRQDTREWVFSYLLMAYAPLKTTDLAAYIALSKTDHGKALNRGLFAGFDQLMIETSYALGGAVSGALQGEDL